MRAQTPSYVVSTKVQLPESIAKRLEKSDFRWHWLMQELKKNTIN